MSHLQECQFQDWSSYHTIQLLRIRLITANQCSGKEGKHIPMLITLRLEHTHVIRICGIAFHQIAGKLCHSAPCSIHPIRTDRLSSVKEKETHTVTRSRPAPDLESCIRKSNRHFRSIMALQRANLRGTSPIQTGNWILVNLLQDFIN